MSDRNQEEVLLGKLQRAESYLKSGMTNFRDLEKASSLYLEMATLAENPDIKAKALIGMGKCHTTATYYHKDESQVAEKAKVALTYFCEAFQTCTRHAIEVGRSIKQENALRALYKELSDSIENLRIALRI